ncbi:phosphoglycerate kinase [Candidatus Saccharibacteria bacterium]|nr:phosphoglycerate kinase [Candidatus Saccharibacteria bacterium]
MRTILDEHIKGQTILMRADFNVPMEGQKITSDLRIRAALPTINYLREHGAKKIILISHLGRPEGKRNKEFSLEPVAKHLQTLLKDAKVSFIDDISGPDVEAAVEKMKNGEILVLENLRFYPGEEENSEEFAQEIVDSTHADLFVQDGFAVVHRAHASTSAITNLIPSVAGLLLEKEVSTLSKVLKNPAKPLLVVIGGAKVEDKQPLIDKFLPIADHIVVGGKIAADGYQAKSDKIYVAEDFDEDIEGNKLDVGPLATVKIAELARDAKTVIWNGALGKVEDPAYATASTVLAELLGEEPNIESIICGGDTTGFVEELMHEHKGFNYSLISTGGGAALEFLSGKSLPGIEALA